MKKGFLGLALLAVTLPVAAEVNYLESEIRFVLPPGAKTIQQAASYFLEPHQYRLLSSDPVAVSIMSRPIPASAPTGGLMTIEEALLGLVEPTEAVVIDTDHRLVTFNKLERELKR